MSSKKTLKRKQSAVAKQVHSSKSKNELLLEETLFGRSTAPKTHVQSSSAKSAEEDDEESGESDIEANELEFVIDTAPNAQQEPVSSKPKAGGAVWQDEDDDELVVDLNQTNRLKKLKTSEHTSSFVTGSQLSGLLKSRFEPQKKAWAMPVQSRDGDSEDDEDALDEEDYQLLTEAQGILKRSGGIRDRHNPIAPEKISIKRLLDANVAEYCAKGVNTTHFHPTNPNLFLVGSEDKILRVFHIDDTKNEKVLGVKFRDLPILAAKFVGANFDEIVVCGRKPFFYVYSMETGHIAQYQVPMHKRAQLKTLEKMAVSPNGGLVAFVGGEGSVHILDVASKQWVSEVKMHSSARAATFYDNNTLATSGFDAEVYLWDVSSLQSDNRAQRSTSSGSVVQCIQRFTNEDGTSTLALASYTPPVQNSVSQEGSTSVGIKVDCYMVPDTDYLCVGALSGVASIYQRSTTSTSSFEPTSSQAPYRLAKSVMNLTTKVTSAAFHPSGQLLAIASDEKKDMLKLVHMPSGSVYMNWPKLLNIKSGGGNPSSSSATTRTGPLHKLQTVEFSPDGTRLALGNARGRVLIYQLNHFAGYNARSHKYTPEESAQTHNGKVANAGTKKVKKPFRK